MAHMMHWLAHAIEIAFMFNRSQESLMASETMPRGRDARTGMFTTVKEAQQHPGTHVVERVPKPGYSDRKKQ
jgi:hypothetical protein